MTIFVIAGTVRQYHDYIQTAGIHPDGARYVVDGEILLKHFGPEDLVIWVGDYWRRPDYEYLKAIVDTGIGIGGSVHAA